MQQIGAWIYLTTSIFTLIRNRDKVLDQQLWHEIITSIVVALILEMLAAHHMNLLCALFLIPMVGVTSSQLFLETIKQLEA